MPPSNRPNAMDQLREKTERRLAAKKRIGLLAEKGAKEKLNPVEKKMLEHELAIAEELQANLLPHRIPHVAGLELNAYYKPSHDVGGDYYDFFELDSEHWGFVVADVSGKGIPGSMVMTEARALLRCEAVRTQSPAEALTRVNRFLHPDLKRGMFVTMLYMIFSVPKRSLLVSSAGHCPLVLYRKATKSCHLVHPGGLALGLDRGPMFEKTIKEHRIALGDGDRFVIYTDGITESMNGNLDVWGTAKLYSTIKELAEGGTAEFVTRLIQAVEDHQGDAEQHDDITLVTGRVTSSPVTTVTKIVKPGKHTP